MTFRFGQALLSRRDPYSHIPLFPNCWEIARMLFIPLLFPKSALFRDHQRYHEQADTASTIWKRISFSGSTKIARYYTQDDDLSFTKPKLVHKQQFRLPGYPFPGAGRLSNLVIEPPTQKFFTCFLLLEYHNPYKVSLSDNDHAIIVMSPTWQSNSSSSILHKW